mgnify:CR=1 FL=1
MQQPPLPQLPPEDAFICDKILRSKKYDDIYFSAEDGLAETRHVFIHGTGLRERLAKHEHLIIAETGFGTGLNFLAVVAEALLLESKSKIDFVSVEGNPLSKDKVAAALRAFPELLHIYEQLLQQWPRRWLGVHHMSFLNGQISLHLHYGQAEHVLPTLNFSADIWFLDGFSPAKNPDIWSDNIIKQIARLSALNSRLATFTVAASVRSSLANAGFACTKASGFGRKRDMLTASYENGIALREKPRPRTALVIGGGIAGCAVAGALKAIGIEVIILDSAAQKGAGASGNPAGIVVPFLTVGDMIGARLSISCLADTRVFLDANDLVISNGVISLDHDKRKSSRQKKIAEQGFPSDLAVYMTADELSVHSGLPVGAGGLLFETGAVIEPQNLCSHLSHGVERIYNAEFTSITGDANVRIAHCADGRIFEADHIVLCTGAELPPLLKIIGHDLGACQITSGQLSILPKTTKLSALQMALNYSGYLTPLVNNRQYLGAGFDPTEDTAVSKKGHLHNLKLMPVSLQQLAEQPSEWEGRTSLRLAYPDRLPVAGIIAPGLSVFSALGARGLTLARLIGKSVAQEIAGRPPILPYQIMMALHPRRFFHKALK